MVERADSYRSPVLNSKSWAGQFSKRKNVGRSRQPRLDSAMQLCWASALCSLAPRYAPSHQRYPSKYIDSLLARGVDYVNRSLLGCPAADRSKLVLQPFLSIQPPIVDMSRTSKLRGTQVGEAAVITLEASMLDTANTSEYPGEKRRE